MPGVSREDLIRQVKMEVMGAIREDVDRKAASAVESLRSQGLKAITSLHQQQAQETSKLQEQLSGCAASCQRLERENMQLRNVVDAMMERLHVLYATVPYMQPHAAAQAAALMQAVPPVSMPSPAAAASATKPPTEEPPSAPTASTVEPAGAAESTASVCRPAGLPSQECAAEDFHTPLPSPLRGAGSVLPGVEVPTIPTTAPPSFPFGGGLTLPASVPGTPGAALPATAATPSTPVHTPKGEHRTFALTLRRADGVPLGLDVHGDAGSPYLSIGAIKPGGAVEAWNRQCAGDAREIRVKDRIVMVNGKEEADAMRAECMQKSLLKMTIVRSVGGNADDGLAATPTAHGLRADANEFVPSSPWPTPTAAPGSTSC